MRKSLRICIVVLGLAVAWGLGPPVVSAQITGSAHDFTTATGPESNFTGAPFGNICSTCHNPHHTGSAILIWNHTLSANVLSFGTNAVTFAGTDLSKDINSAPGTSKLCLSCHDGSVAVGDLIEGAWTANGTNVITDPVKLIASTTGDVSKNHPVAIPYPDTVASEYNSVITAADPTAYVGGVTGAKVYGVSPNRHIECGSCHEPHKRSTHGPLLRNGFTCQSCHNL